MSAEALNLFNRLRQSGMAEDMARQLAESLDARIAEIVGEYNRRAEQAVERVRTETVSADEYHRRMEITPTRDETDNKIDQLRADMNAHFVAQERRLDGIERRLEGLERRMDALYRVLVGILLVAGGGAVAVAAAAVKFILGL